ncbi:MAG: hypothetical protein OIN83_01380 [Candidatus Methanoperedens sp.]|nr:hypothetical protein [Candidatus Methanoperedens sp.]
MKKIIVCFIIVLLMAFPASAGEVSLNKWVLNVTIGDDGMVEETIQAEFENSGTTSIDGFSFVVPASGVVIGSDNIMSIPSTGTEVKQQTIPGGIKISINFDRPIEAGMKWNGRLSLTAQNWAVKEGPDYSIIIPVDAPKAIIAGKEVEFSLPSDPEIRSQVFLPKAVNVTAVEVKSKDKKSYKKLLQFDKMVITWFQLNLGDEISIKGSYSDILKLIIETDEKSRQIKERIKNAREAGQDVSEAESHLLNAEEYNNNQALQSFWINDFKVVQEYVGYANDELNLAEKSLSEQKETEVIPEETEKSNSVPGFGGAGLILIICGYCIKLRRKRSKL